MVEISNPKAPNEPLYFARIFRNDSFLVIRILPFPCVSYFEILIFFLKFFSELILAETKFCCADPFSLKSYSYSIICVNWSHCSFFLYRGGPKLDFRIFFQFHSRLFKFKTIYVFLTVWVILK